MINSDDILPYGRFKYSLPYSGSCKGMRYRIVHPKPAEGEENLFYIDIWMGPYSYDKSDSSTFIKKTFEYSQEGYNEIIPYLNEIYSQYKERWESVEALSLMDSHK